MVGIIQLRVGQRSRCGNTRVGTGKAQPHRCVHLCQRILAGHQQIGKPCVGAPLDTALDIVIDFADGGRHAGCDAGSCLIRPDPGQIYAAGHLDIAVIGAVYQVRTACIGHIIRLFLILGSCIHQQRVGPGICLVHGQAEGNAGIRGSPLTVVGHRQSQRRSRFRTVPNGCVLNVACLRNRRRQNHRVCVPVQVIDRQRSTQRAFFCIIVGCRAGCAVKPVHRCRAGPGPAEYIIRRRIDYRTRLVCFLLFAQVHVNTADDRCRLAVHLVPGNTGRRCEVEGRFRRVVIGRLHRPVDTEVPCLYECRILTGYLFNLVNREPHHILAGVRHLVAHVVALLIQVRKKIKTGVTF